MFWFLARLKLKYFSQSGLSSFDARRKHSFLSGQRGEQDCRVGKTKENAVILCYGTVCLANVWN